VATVTFKLTGKSPLIYGAKARSPKKDKESDDDHDKRCWMERAHTDDEGNLRVPALAIKRMLESAAGHRGDKIPGQGAKTYKKAFEAGIAAFEDAILDKTSGDLVCEPRHVDSKGRKGGSGSRVTRRFPIVLTPWTLTATVIVLDWRINQNVFMEFLSHGGLFCGLGTWRPGTGGMYGRFTAEMIEWRRDEFDRVEAIPVEKKKKEKTA
jgi:hypothetical protein